MITCPDCGTGVLPDQPPFKSAADLLAENERLREALHHTKSALTNVAYLDVTNLGTEAESKRPSRYFECRLCGDWNDRIKHIRHAEGCPLSDYQI